MLGRRLICLAVQLGCVVFYWAYREWLSWLLLMLVLALPWFSLLVSLPAILSCRITPRCPAFVTQQEAASVTCVAVSALPLPTFRSKLSVRHGWSGQRSKLSPFTALPTEHCGHLEVRPHRAYVLDYLGLFRIRAVRTAPASVLVRPRPLAATQVPNLRRYFTNAWRPKAGGGYAENHELRPYRPGDSLRQIHWKLSAKTGTYIFREPIEPLRGIATVTLELTGDSHTLDRKLGRLLWACSWLLSQEVPHQICCLTGDGMQVFPVHTQDDLTQAIDALLSSPTADPHTQAAYPQAAWRYHIDGSEQELPGGDAHEE